MKEKTINILIQILGKDLEIVYINNLYVWFSHKNKNFRIWYKTKFVEEIKEEQVLPISKEARAIGMKVKEFFSEKKE